MPSSDTAPGPGRPTGGWRLRAGRRPVAILVTSVLALLVAVGDCTSGAPVVPVTAAQQTAITRYYLERLWPPYADADETRVSCPVDVLGAAPVGQRLRVYTVIHCEGYSAKCGIGTSYTEGLVADLDGTRVVGVQRDDAPDIQGATAQASIYPYILRSTALADLDSGGPAWLRNLAVKMTGCDPTLAQYRG